MTYYCSQYDQTPARKTCRDDALVEQLIPQRFDNIAKVEAVINDKLVADRRRKGLGRSSSKPSRDGSRRNDAGRRDDRRGDREDRRGDGRSRRDDRYSRQVTLVDASVDELYEAWSDKMAITSRRRADSDDYERVSNHSDVSYRSDSESDGEYIDAAETGHFPDRSGGQRTDFAGRNESSPSQTRRNDAAPRRRWGDSDRRFAEPVVEANYVFAFIRQGRWLKNDDATEIECETDGKLEPIDEPTLLKSSQEVGESTGIVTSATPTDLRPSPRCKAIKLNKGERKGWWSKKQFDK
ncbi:unnamed protein product [Phytophthora lilii]|uniref:Unnamed protein product n=1 Tax=Phytophthora lilii TaxID=2077276 RepID=A0A9W6YFW0_9STRA|nr:unnamed protein product [Phytophthora lilii]